MLSKVRRGQHLADHLTAAAWNAFVDAAAAHQAGQLPLGAGMRGFGAHHNIGVVRNDSGAARDRYDLLALQGVAFTPSQNLRSFQAGVAWTGGLPTLADFGRFMLLLEPAAAGRYARGILGGLAVTRVHIGHLQHAYADVAAGSARLTSNWVGSAELLYREPGIGEKWAVVRLGTPFLGPLEGVVAEAGGIAPGASGAVTVWSGGAVTSPPSTITAHYRWMTGDSAPPGTEVVVAWVRDQQRFVIHNMGCSA